MKIENGIVYLQNILDPFDWSVIFPDSHPVVLDLGAGDGGFAAEYATLHRDRNILAVERLLGRARKIGRKSVRFNLPNLRVVRLESTYLLRHLIPTGSVAEIHVLFPDPWPKKRHQDRRIIQGPFLESVSRNLVPGGLFRFVTDHEEYFQWALPTLQQAPFFRQVAASDYPHTDFEKEFRALGKPIYEWVSQRLDS